MSRKRTLRISLVFIPLVVLLPFLILASLAVFDVALNLSVIKDRIEKAGTVVLNRPVHIDGDIAFVPFIWPTIEISKLRVDNPDGFPGHFAELGSARIQAGILPLLLGRIHVEAFDIRNATIHLNRTASGDNWTFFSDVPVEPGKAIPEDHRGPFIDQIQLDKVHFSNVAVIYNDMGKERRFTVDKLDVSGSSRGWLTMKAKGSVLEEPYTLHLKAGAKADITGTNVVWPMNCTASIAGTTLQIEGKAALPVSRYHAGLRFRISGDDLTSLNKLTGLDLPPLKKYHVGATIEAQKNLYTLHAFEVGAGSSLLKGNATIERTERRIPIIHVALNAPTIQLDDFRFKGWTPASGSQGNATQPDKAKQQADKAEEPKSLLSYDVLKSIDASLAVHVGEVLSGKDKLGSGTMKLALDNATLSLDPLQLNIPGGSMNMSVRVQETGQTVRASLKTKIERFDFGVLARRANPNTKMGGTLGLNIDLKSEAPNVHELAANANGTFAVSIAPKNLKAGIIDLWAVNLMAALLPSLDKGEASVINCAICELEMNNGIMTPTAVLLDTTNIRAGARGEVDFKDNTIAMTFAPEAKAPQMFSAATPVRVTGTFKDFGIGVNTLDVIGSVLRMIVSPITYPFELAFENRLPPDGGDVCAAALANATKRK